MILRDSALLPKRQTTTYEREEQTHIQYLSDVGMNMSGKSNR